MIIMRLSIEKLGFRGLRLGYGASLEILRSGFGVSGEDSVASSFRPAQNLAHGNPLCAGSTVGAC